MKPTISLAPDGRLQLEFPTNHLWAGYGLKIDASVGGLEILVGILQRYANGDTKLGTAGAPTQFVVDKWLKEDRARKRQAKKEELGFELDFEV